MLLKEDKNITIKVWNREYVFQNKCLPQEILVGGENILYAPCSFTAEFSGEDGVWRKEETIVFEAGEEQAVFAAACETENIILNADIKAEEDGLLKIGFRLIPYWSFSNDQVQRITGFYLDIPVKKKFASMLHFWPNCESGVCLSGKVLNSFGLEQGANIELPFKPYVWLGWEYGGLGLCCESDRGFELSDPEMCITIKDEGDYINLRMRFFDTLPLDWRGREDEWGNNLNPKTFTIGLQATPVKEFPKEHLTDWRAFHLWDVTQHPIFAPVQGKGDTMLEQVAASGAKWLILHEDWSCVQNYGKPYDEEDFKRFVKECHCLGLKLMVYFGYEVSSLYPGFNEEADKLLNKNVRGNFVGGWQREPMQRDYTVCYHGEYSETMLKRVAFVMDELGVDGIYTDGTYVPWECANENHGCGYRDSQGILHEIYPIFAVREHVKKLYNEVHKRGGIIDTHQSSCCLMATLSYADSYFDGENIQGMLQQDLSFLKLDSFRCEFMGNNMGIPCNFISYTTDDMTIEKLAGLTFLHGIFPRARVIEDLEFMKNLWTVCDDFDISEAKFVPYWERNAISVDKANVYVSEWKNKNKLLLCIFSTQKGAQKVEIDIGDAYSGYTVKKAFRKDNRCCADDFVDDVVQTISNGKVSVEINAEQMNLFIIM